jgi:hypothetical protein
MKRMLLCLAVLALACGCLGGDTPAATQTTLAKASAPTSPRPTVTTSTAPSSSSTTTTTLGALGSRCQTYRDCMGGLLCKDGNCSSPPLYAENFIRVELQKINASTIGTGRNMTYAANKFKTTDGLYVELTPKPEREGMLYSDVNDAVTGEKVMISPKRRLEATHAGALGWGLPNPGRAGKYELNVYFRENLTYSTTFEVTA